MMIVNNIARTLAVLSLATSSLFVFPTGSGSFAQSNNNRITGYAWGKITEFTSLPRHGTPNQGTLAVGGTTERYAVPYSTYSVRTVNPLKFAVESAEFVSRVNMNENVWISFYRNMVVREVQPVTKKSPAACSTKTVSRKAGDVRRSVTGSLALVQIVQDDRFKGQYTEVYVVRGTRFMRIYIDDVGIYRCAIEAVKSGKPVTLNYTEVKYSLWIWSHTVEYVDTISPVR